MSDVAPNGARGAIGADALIETVEGPLAIAGLVGKSMPVLTRLLDGRIGFRLMTEIRQLASGVAVVRVVFDNDQAMVVARAHVFLGPAMAERTAAALAPGEALDTSYHFPPGYVFRRTDGSEETSIGAVRVAAVEDAGTADVFGGVVRETHCYFATAGVLCRA